ISIHLFFSSSRRHSRFSRDCSSDVCSSDLIFFTVPDHLVEHLDKLKPITFWSELSENITRMLDKAIQRVALALDIPSEILTGSEIGRASCRECVLNMSVFVPFVMIRVAYVN